MKSLFRGLVTSLVDAKVFQVEFKPGFSGALRSPQFTMRFPSWLSPGTPLLLATPFRFTASRAFVAHPDHARDALFSTSTNNSSTERQRDATPPDETEQSIGHVTKSLSTRLGFGDNQFANGGLQLLVIGGALAGLRYLGDEILGFIRKRLIVTAEFDSRDESYDWIMNWLADHPYASHTTNFTVSTNVSANRNTGAESELDKHSSLRPVYFLPSPGIHFFFYHRRLVWLFRERIATKASSSSGKRPETLYISMLGRSTSRSIIQCLINEAQIKYTQKDRARTVVFAVDQYGSWRRTRSKPRRPMETIVLEKSVKDMIVEDAKEFFNTESWYANRGIPYRRGYLFYGCPGTGKSSTVHALAGELGLNIYVLNLANKSLTDNNFSDLVTDTPARCILLIEDVDAAFVQRLSGEGVSNGVTFSGLLNTIDGVSAQEGRILCLTTNHIEKLDAALIRPGRIDVRICFGLAKKIQARELFMRFYPADEFDTTSNQAVLTSSENTLEDRNKPLYQPDDIEKLADCFAAEVPDQVYSVAMLQGFLMNYRRNPAAAVQAFEVWNEKHQGDSGKRATEVENTAPDQANTVVNDTKIET